MPSDIIPFTSAQLESQMQTWLDQLGRVNRYRLAELIPLFTDGKASLDRALAIVAPGKKRADALGAYQVFASRVNEGAERAKLRLRLCVDSAKQSAPVNRYTWVEGPSPDVASLAQFTREAVSTLDQQDALVPPTAVILASEEQEDITKQRPLIRFFISYASHDDKLVERLREPLEKELRLSKRFQFEIWHDRLIQAGVRWKEGIEKALGESHFGLLLVSRDFLLSSFITQNELPYFVKGTKPVIPIGLSTLDLRRVDLKGLEQTQIFRFRRSGEPLRFFSECRGPMKDDFVRQLASQIEERVAKSLAEKAAEPAKGRPRKSHAEAKGAEVEEDLVFKLSRGIFSSQTSNLDRFVPPDLAPTDFSQLEKDTSLLTLNRTRAVKYLAQWATSTDGPRFCAVLGEVGIGKTTTLMLLANELDKRRVKDPSVPPVIFIDLKEYYLEGDPNLEDILAEVIRRHWKGDGGRQVTPEMIVRAVQERGALIIFDGLDERIIPLPEARRDGFIRQLWKVLPPASHEPRPGTRVGKLIISCRSHYFPTVTALSSAFIGGGREGIRQSDYVACVILPFSDQQVRNYLSSMLGESQVENALAVISSIHNLGELSTRPYLLSLIAPELAELERLKKEGRTVYGVTLYELLVEKWLLRDDNKHQFTPEHKLLMMEALAAHLCAIKQKMLPWKKVAKWLDDFLDAHVAIRDRYKNTPPEVLNQDFRTATFCLRPDDSKEGFRFAHTSLYEYFLALHLVHALEANRPAAWDLPLPSDETLDFTAQILAASASVEGNGVNVPAALGTWSRLLDSASAPAQARRIAFRAWLIAHRKGWPTPSPRHPQLHQLDLAGWKIGNERGPLLDLRGASLVGSCLDHAEIRRVLLSGSKGDEASLCLANLSEVTLDDSSWQKANFTGGTWRHCLVRNFGASTADWHDCDVTTCDFTGARLPANWRNEAAAEMKAERSEFAVVLRQGHSGNVNAVAWSPDGTRVLTGGDDRTVKIWDAASGRCVLSLETHQDLVTSVAWSPDGTRILAGGNDKTVKIWDASSGRLVLSLEGHQDLVTSVAWSRDGTRVLTGGDGRTVKIWEADSGKCIGSLETYQGSVRSVAWSPDGTQVLTGGSDSTARIWDVESGRCLRNLEMHQDWIRSVAWSPDGTRVLTGGSDSTTRIWDVESGRCLHSLEGHQDLVMSVAWSPDGKWVLTGGNDRTVKIWDSSSGKCILTLEGHQDWIRSVAWSQDGTRALTGGNDRTVKIWDTSNLRIEHEQDTRERCMLNLEGHQNWVRSVAWSPDGTRVLTGGNDRTVKVWDVDKGRCIFGLEGHQDLVECVAWSPDGTRVLTGGNDKTVKIWDAGSGRCILSLEGHQGSVMSVAWSPDGTQVLAGWSDSTVRIWDAESGRCVLSFEARQDWVMSAAWSPDGTRVLTGGNDRTVKIWDASNGRCLLSLEGHQDWVRSVAWSPDGTRVLSGGDDRTAKIWNASNGRCVLSLEKHQNWVMSVAWSPDGTRVLTGGSDSTVKIWDAGTGHCVVSLEGHQGSVVSVAWSADGTRVLSGGDDSTTREWDSATGKLLRTWVIQGNEVALVDFSVNRILHATPEAWRLLGWQGWDPKAQRRRLLPADVFGPLPYLVRAAMG